MRHAIAAAVMAVGWIASTAVAQTPSVYSAEARRALEAIRPDALEAHLRFLADDRLAGRGAGTAGYDLAAGYVAAQFQRLGLEPAGDQGGWLQTVPLRRAILLPERCAISVSGGRPREPLVIGRDFLMRADAYRREIDVSAEAVFVGYGITAPELGHDDFAGLDARGKIAVVLSGAPPRFPPTLRAHYSNPREKEANLAAHGVVGVLTVRTPQDERRTAWNKLVLASRLAPMRWLDARGVPDGDAPEIQGRATLHRAAAESLFRGAERSLEQVFGDVDRDSVRGFSLPVRVRLRCASLHEDAPSPNVIARLPGSDPRLSQEVVVLSAHLDHLGVGAPVEGDSVYNGAFDNATGVAALLEIAAAFSQGRPRPRRSLLFLAVTAEEKGLQGSSYFAQHPTLPIERIVADINLDMYVMVGPLRDIVAHGAEHSTLGSAVNLAAARLGLKVAEDPAPEQMVFVRSDQYSFVRQGVPSIFAVGGSGESGRAARQRWAHDIYHTPQDDLNQPLDFESLARFARFHLLVAYQVANQSEPPRWKPRDFFGERFGRR